MPASLETRRKSSLDASVPFLTAPAKENDGEAVPYNSRIFGKMRTDKSLG